MTSTRQAELQQQYATLVFDKLKIRTGKRPTPVETFPIEWLPASKSVLFSVLITEYRSDDWDENVDEHRNILVALELAIISLGWFQDGTVSQDQLDYELQILRDCLGM